MLIKNLKHHTEFQKHLFKKSEHGKILHFLTEHGSDYHQMWLKEAQCHVEAFNTLPHTEAHWHIVP